LDKFKKIDMKKNYILSAVLVSFGFGVSAQIADGGFETGSTGTTWTQASTNFGSPLCDAGCGTGGGTCGPNNGAWYVWFGGATSVETGSVIQSAVVPTGTTATLNMNVKIAAAGTGLPADRMEVSLDGVIIRTITSADSLAYANYALLSIPINAAANGASHNFKIEGFQSTAGSFNLLVDDVTLTVNGASLNLFEFETGENEVIIFPNPAKELVNLQFRNVTGEVNVVITDLTGKVVSNEILSAVFGGTFSLNTSSLNSGSYILTVSQNETILRTENVVISK
jgi:hypothetical protein